MSKQYFSRRTAVAVVVGLLAGTPLLGGCGSDDHHDRYGSSRDYDERSRSPEYTPDAVPGYNARQARNTGGEYVPDPVPGYNARQTRNARKDAERYDRPYDYGR